MTFYAPSQLNWSPLRSKFKKCNRFCTLMRRGNLHRCRGSAVAATTTTSCRFHLRYSTRSLRAPRCRRACGRRWAQSSGGSIPDNSTTHHTHTRWLRPWQKPKLKSTNRIKINVTNNHRICLPLYKHAYWNFSRLKHAFCRGPVESPVVYRTAMTL